MVDTRFTAGLPQALTLTVGRTVQLPLRSAMGAGNSWQSRVDNDNVDARLVVLPPNRDDQPAGGLPPGTSSATEVLVLTGIRPGTATLTLRLGRPWEPGDPLAVHHIGLTVESR